MPLISYFFLQVYRNLQSFSSFLLFHFLFVYVLFLNNHPFLFVLAFLSNISYNKNYRFAFIKVHIDNITEFKDTHGEKAYNTILDIIKETLLKVVEYRGVAGNPDNETEYVVIVKDLYNESELRAFIEYMRSRIIWECKAFDVSFMPLFSIGIGRYPDNGTDFKVITDKLIKATDIAISKGGNRYIIYKEDIHGEL